MIDEVLKDVIDAENEANRLLDEALAQAKQIVLDAETKAEMQKKQVIAECKASYQRAIATAEQKAEADRAKVLADAERDADVFVDKKTDAVDKVAEQLVEILVKKYA